MNTNKFVNRHIGISESDVPAMLEAIGVKSIDELIDQTIPANIRLKSRLNRNGMVRHRLPRSYSA